MAGKGAVDRLTGYPIFLGTTCISYQVYQPLHSRRVAAGAPILSAERSIGRKRPMVMLLTEYFFLFYSVRVMKGCVVHDY